MHVHIAHSLLGAAALPGCHRRQACQQAQIDSAPSPQSVPAPARRRRRRPRASRDPLRWIASAGLLVFACRSALEEPRASSLVPTLPRPRPRPRPHGLLVPPAATPVRGRATTLLRAQCCVCLARHRKNPMLPPAAQRTRTLPPIVFENTTTLDPAVDRLPFVPSTPCSACLP